MKYRPDIDGLRAVAVLAVIAAHIGVQHLPGGFLGVDVFFVISGYLISGIIYADIVAEKFSIAAFYERRVRRIAPALIVVLLAVTAFAYLYILPVEVKDFSRSLLATIFCVSNIYFWTQAGYFASPSADKPLLHTWSLSVEEQFYLLFPALLLFCYRFYQHKIKHFVVALFLLSLAASVAGSFYYPDARFYLASNRAWELLLGALIAMDIAPEISGGRARHFAGVAGLALIALSCLFVSPVTPYLGLLTMLPCLGAALIIAAGKSGHSLTGSLLSLRPIAFIGTISYSLYLWHWPLIVFHRMGFLSSAALSPKMEKIAAIIIMIVVATFSWKFIETPFRKKLMPRRMVFSVAFAGALLLAFIAGFMWDSDGMPGRFSSDVVRVAAYLDYDPAPVSRWGSCFVGDIFSFKDYDSATCLHRDDHKKNYLLIGDSHAAHLWYGLSTVFPDINFMQATASGCKPMQQHVLGTSDQCAAVMDYVYKTAFATEKVDTLLIEASWNDTDLPLLPGLIEDAKTHADHVILFGPIVQYDEALPRLMAIALRSGDHTYIAAHRRDELRHFDKEIAAIAREKHIRYVSFFDLLCSAEDCVSSAADGAPILYDYGHLTKEGSLYVAQALRDKAALQ